MKFDTVLNISIDRINRIIRIKRPSAEGRIAAGEKKIFTPLNLEEQLAL